MIASASVAHLETFDVYLMCLYEKLFKRELFNGVQF